MPPPLLHERKEPYRQLLHGEREIAIGARARRQRLLRLGTAAIGVLLIGVAVWLYVALSHATSPPAPDSTLIPVRCTHCGQESVVRAPAAGADGPLECPKCHTRSAYKLWICHDCGTTFIPPISAAAPAVKCPKCGSSAVGTAPIPPGAMP